MGFQQRGPLWASLSSHQRGRQSRAQTIPAASAASAALHPVGPTAMGEDAPRQPVEGRLGGWTTLGRAKRGWGSDHEARRAITPVSFEVSAR